MKFRKILSAVTALAMSASAVAGLAVTASADVTTNAKIVVSDSSVIGSDGVLSGDTNSMTLSNIISGSHPFAINTTNPSLTVGKGTGTVTIDSDKYAKDRDVVNVSFDLAFGNLTKRNVYFYLYDSSTTSIASFACTIYNDTNRNLTTNLGLTLDDIDTLGITFDNNYAYWASRVTFDITLDYAHNRITTKLTNNNNAKSVDAVVAMTNTNSMASFVIGSNYDNDDRRCEFNNLLITTTEGDYSATQKTITYNYKTTGGDDIPSEDLPSDALTSEVAYVGESFTPIYPETFDTDECHYVYSSGGDMITVEDTTESVTLYYDAIINAEITVTATADDGITDLTDSMLSDKTISGYVGGDYSYFPYAYIEQGGIYYKYSGVQEDGSVTAVTGSFTQASETKNLEYTKVDSVVYYTEFDSVNDSSNCSSNRTINDANKSNSNASGGIVGGYVYANSSAYLAIANIPIESAGTYKVTANTPGAVNHSTNSGSRSCYITMDDTTVDTDTPELVSSSDKPCNIATLNVHLDAGNHTFYYVSNGSSGCYVDYIVIELVSLDPVITAAVGGTVSGTTLGTLDTDQKVKDADGNDTTITYGTLVDNAGGSGKVTTIYAMITNPTDGVKPTITVTDSEGNTSSTDGTDNWSPVYGTNVYFAQLLGDPAKFKTVTISYDNAASVTLDTDDFTASN